MTRQSLAIAIAVAVMPVAWGNLLTNPGFETGNLTGWTGTGTVHILGWFWGAAPRSGTYGWGSASNWAVTDDTITQTVAVTAGSLYRASGWFWLYSTGIYPENTGAEIQVDWKNSGGGTISTSQSGWHNQPMHGNYVWFQISNDWTAPVGAVQAVFRTRHVGDGQGGGGWGVATGDDLLFYNRADVGGWMLYME